MVRFAALTLVAVLLPIALALPGLGLGGGLGIGLELHIPPIHLGTPLTLLIDLRLALQIIATPYDPIHGINDCSSGNGTSKVAVARNGLSGTDNRWYDAGDGTWYVPVAIDPAFSQDELNTIYAGMVNIDQNSCMRIYVYDEANLQGYDYVRIERGASGCFSNYIGRAHVGKQIVNLAPPACSGCGHCIWAGTTAHELLHAIGFHHMQNTAGRDEYVSIQWGNIESGKESQFYEWPETTSFGAPYDYDSVMHYSKNAFSKNPSQLDTIVVYSGDAIGQRNGLSYWDGYKVNAMHGCST